MKDQTIFKDMCSLQIKFWLVIINEYIRKYASFVQIMFGPNYGADFA